jgi:hypothetical protein
MPTARGEIELALKLIGQLSEGETPSSETMTDGLSVFNMLLDSWSLESLSVFTTQEQVFSWGAGQASRTIGATGNFVGIRPTIVQSSSFLRISNNDYTLTLLTEPEYNGIVNKSIGSTIPDSLFVEPTYPNSTLYLYPVPSQTVELHLISPKPFTSIANLSDLLSYPPGYNRAFLYNLACELASFFGVEPSPTVQRIAATSKENLRRINDPMIELSMPPEMSGAPRFNIYKGY